MEKINNIKKSKNVFKVLFIISLVLLLGGCGTLSYFLIEKNNQKEAYATTLQNSYTRNFTELSATLNEIDVNISKFLATSTVDSRQKVLLTIWRDCSSCQTNLSNLPLDHESISNTLSFVNKLGEYCYYLSVKIVDDKTLTSDDFVVMEELSVFSNVLNHDISLLARNVANGNFDVLNTFNGTAIDDFANFLDSLNESTVETPSMIYDGPYSESQENREVKGLGENICSAEEAKIFISNIFEIDSNLITYIGETVSMFETYNFEFDVSGQKCYVQITKKGKFLLQFNREGESGLASILKEDAINKSLEFFKKVGIYNMQANWINVTENEILINFAPVINDVMIYSDLIKIKVSKVSGNIIGFEAVSYAFNHHERQISNANVSLSEAQEVVSDKLLIENSRLCIIPKTLIDEVLAYEFKCSYNNFTYYVYINAQTGEEEEIFRVVQDENEGELVI